MPILLKMGVISHTFQLKWEYLEFGKMLKWFGFVYWDFILKDSFLAIKIERHYVIKFWTSDGISK